MVKNLLTNLGDVRDVGSIPGWTRPLGEGKGSPLQYSCLEIPMDRGARSTESQNRLESSDMIEAT